MGQRLKGLASNLLLVAASIVVAIGLVEATFRLFPGLATEEVALRMHWQAVRDIRDDQGDRPIVDDPVIGFLGRPDYKGAIERGDLHFTYATDANGFRNPPGLGDKADIVVLGDSMAFGYGVDDGKGWIGRVRAARPDLRIANLGLIGAAPEQYRRVWERFGAPLRPRLVLCVLFPGNDINDEAVFARWLRDGHGMSFTDWRMQVAEPGGGGGVLGPWLEQSYVWQFIREARRRLTTPFSGRTVDFANGQRVRLAPAAYAANVPRSDPGNPDFQRVMRTIEATGEEVAATGARFIVLLMPTKELVYLSHFNEPAPDPLPTFRTELAKQDVAFLDLTPGLQAKAMDEPLFFEVDGHPDAAGYQVIADEVLEKLNDELMPRQDAATAAPAALVR
jgi:lysophospholipase L1-like esterase